MKRISRAFRWIVPAGTLAALSYASLLQAQITNLGQVKGTGIDHPEYFAPPFQNQVKFHLTSSEAELLSMTQFRLLDVKLQTFSTNGTLEFTLRAPECIYDIQEGAVNSTNSIRMETGDGAILMEGDGFCFRLREGGKAVKPANGGSVPKTGFHFGPAEGSFKILTNTHTRLRIPQHQFKRSFP
jgi:hypothetical protein